MDRRRYAVVVLLVAAFLCGRWSQESHAAAQDLDGVADVQLFNLLRRLVQAEEDQSSAAERSARALEHIQSELGHCR